MSTNTKHKYNSPMKRIYYQSSSGGRPRDPSGDSEAMDLAKSLINFSDEIRQTAYSDAEHNKKDAQVVFDTLKAQGITDPDEIKTLIENDDERVKPLKKRYTQSVIDSNFGLSHAVQDFKLLNTKITSIVGDDEKGEAMANLDIDGLLAEITTERNLNDQSISYNRGYTESLNNLRLDLDEKKSKAKGYVILNKTNQSIFEQIGVTWENNGARTEDNTITIENMSPPFNKTVKGEVKNFPSKRIDMIEMLFKNKVQGDKFITAKMFNTQLLNYFEQRADLKKTGIITDPEELSDIVKYLTRKRGNGTLPSLLDMPEYQEQATKIITSIQGTMFKSDKLALAVDLIDNNKVYLKDEVPYVSSSGEQKIGLENDIINDGIILWSQNAKIAIDEEVAKGNIPPELAEFTYYQVISKKLDANGIQHPTWKNEIEMGFNSLNVIKTVGGTEEVSSGSIDIFNRGFERWKKLKTNYGGKIPTAYANEQASTFYMGVDHLMRNTDMTQQEAIMSMWKAIKNPTNQFANTGVKTEDIYKEVHSAFDGFWDESGAWGAVNWIPWFEKIPFVNKEDQPFWADWITKQGQFNWSDVDFELVAQRATRTAMTLIKGGIEKNKALEYAMKMTAERHILIDGVLVNNSTFPMADAKKLTERSQFVAKEFERVWEDHFNKEKLSVPGKDVPSESTIDAPFGKKGDLKYYKEDLVIRPYMSGLYYLTDKNSGLPVMTPDGNYVIISQMDFVDPEGSVQSAIQNKEDIMETIMKQNKNNKILQLSESLKINKMVNNK